MSNQIAENLPLDEASDKPLVTFALFAYNQEKYIRKAVEGAFSQTYEPLEIILSDDYSSDQTFEIMTEIAAAYRGPHRIELRRNQKNLGLAAHVNAVLELSRGQIILLAAGDDVSLPDRSEVSIEIFKRYPAATAVILSADVMDHTGKIVGERFVGRCKTAECSQTIGDLLAGRHATFGATRAFRREIFAKFGSFRNDCPTEDTPLLLRSLICGMNILSHRKGIRYRTHATNLSGRASMQRMNVDAIYAQYLDDIVRAETSALITEGLADKLRRWMPIDRKSRQVRLKMSGDDRLNINECVFVLWYPAFGFRDKMKAMVKCILPLRRGTQ